MWRDRAKSYIRSYKIEFGSVKDWLVKTWNAKDYGGQRRGLWARAHSHHHLHMSIPISQGPLLALDFERVRVRKVGNPLFYRYELYKCVINAINEYILYTSSSIWKWTGKMSPNTEPSSEPSSSAYWCERERSARAERAGSPGTAQAQEEQELVSGTTFAGWGATTLAEWRKET